MPTSRIPQWLQIAITIATICIAAVLAAQSAGQLALPMTIISVLSVMKLALGLFSESWQTITTNKAIVKESMRPPGIV
jgi:hypothetical protein